MGGENLSMDHVAALSHKGRRHPTNEDSILSVSLDGGALLLVVADGVGGERAGEVASREAVQTVEKHVRTNSSAAPLDRLEAGIQLANTSVWKSSSGNPKLRGMATTVVAAIVENGTAWLTNVGDSRAYLIHDSRIEQITLDHSLVAERVRDGDLTEAEAKESRARHIITRSVGSAEEVEVDRFGPIRLPADSHLLLCSDGLYDVVDDAEIAAIVSSAPPAEAATRLVERANEEGGPDNISVVLYHETGDGAPVKAKRISARSEAPSRYAIAGITTALAILVGGITLGASVLNADSQGGSSMVLGANRPPTVAAQAGSDRAAWETYPHVEYRADSTEFIATPANDTALTEGQPLAAQPRWVPLADTATAPTALIPPQTTTPIATPTSTGTATSTATPTPTPEQ